MSINDLASVLAMALFPLLQENEGVAVHFEGKGYIVCKKFDSIDKELQIKVIEDDSVLNCPDRQLLWVHDEPVGNA